MSDNLHIPSSTHLQSVPAPAASVGLKDRLAQALDVANKLLVDVEYLAAETEDLFSTLTEIANDAVVAAPDIANITAVALDDACWLARATENVQSAFDSLTSALLEVNEV